MKNTIKTDEKLKTSRKRMKNFSDEKERISNNDRKT